MADSDSVFPLILSIREDGSIAARMDEIEQSILVSTRRAGTGFEYLGKQATELRDQLGRKIADPLGIQAQLRALSASPLQKAFEQQAAAANSLTQQRSSAETALAQQQARASVERVAQIGREFDAAMGAIRAEQAARTDANAAALAQFKSTANTVAALAQQQAAEVAKLIAAPRNVSFGFDPAGIEAAASAARVQAERLTAVAAAAERSRDRVAAASQIDRAYAAGARQAADAAAEEARRLTDLAATQARVAAGRSSVRLDQRSGAERLVDGSASIDRAALAGVRLDQVLARVNRNSGQFSANIDRAADGLGRFEQLRRTADFARTGAERLVQGAAAIDRAAVSGTTLDQVLARVADRSVGLAQNAARARQEQEHQAAAAREAADAARLAAEATARQAAEAARLVAGPQVQQQTLYFDPKGSAQAATQARAQAVALAEVARQAEIVAAATANVTATDRAFAVSARSAADAAEQEAQRLGEVAATQGRVAAAVAAGGSKAVQASDLVTNSVRGQRLAVIQASQQFQDFFIQIQGGTSPLIALSQQGSQLAFVLANSGGEAGKFARFMAGPWGSLILGGVAVISLLVTWLNSSAEASKGAEQASKAFADRQADMSRFIDQVTGSLRAQNRELAINAVYTNQKTIADKQREQGDLTSQAQALVDRIAQRTAVGSRFVAERQPTQRITDPVLTRIVADAGGDLTKLTQGLQGYARTRPELQALVADFTSLAGRATLAGESVKELSGNQRDLQTALRGGVVQTTALIERQLDAAAATTRLEKAQARLNDVRARSSGIDNMISGAEKDRQLARYKADLAAAQREVKAAEAAKSAGASARTLAGRQLPTLNAEAALAAADGPVDKAKAMLALAKAEGAEQVRSGKLTADAYRSRVAAAENALDAAQAVKKGNTELAASLSGIAGRYDVARAAALDYGKELAEIAKLEAAGPAAGGITTEDADRYRAAAAAARDKRIADAQAAAAEAAITPYQRATTELDQQLAIQAALANGDERRADILQLQYQNQERFKLSAADALDLAIRQVDAEDAYARKKQVTLALVQSQVAAAGRLQGAFEDLLAAPFKKGSLNDLSDALTKSRQRQIAEQISIQLFGGDLASKVHDALTRNNGPTLEAADALKASARDLSAAAAGFKSAANDNPSVAQLATTPSAYGGQAAGVPTATDAATGDIVVTGQRLPQASVAGGLLAGLGSFLGLTPSAIRNDKQSDRQRQAQLSAQTVALSYAAQAIGGKGGAYINALLNSRQLSGLGVDIAKGLGGKLNDKGEAILGGLKGGLGGAAGGAISGLGTGQQVAALYNLLGIKHAGSGAQIGGALGGAIGGPVGAAIGALGGGLLGSLLYKAPRGGVSITGVDASSYSGSGKLSAGLNSNASSVQQRIQQIADQLGATVGAFGVAIGKHGDYYHVSGSANGDVSAKHPKIDVLYEGKDEAAAITAAILNAIQDGAIQGLRAGTQRLLQASGDTDRQLQKALQFEGVFTQLKQLTDPIGAARDAVEKEFANLGRIFDEAGADATDRAALEQLHTLKLADAIKAAGEQLNGQLKSFYADLTYRGDSGLSLRTREQTALADLSPLIAQIQAGKTVDQEQFTGASRAYLDIERLLYGSTNPYFEALARITDLTNKAIANTGAGANVLPFSDAVTSAAAAASEAAVASVTTFAIPEDRVAMMTAGQFSSAVEAGVSAAFDRQTASLSAQLGLQTATIVKAVQANAAADPGFGLAQIAALRNA